MVSFFDILYSRIGGNNIFLQKLKIYSFFRYIILIVSNLIIKIVYSIDRRKRYELKKFDDNDKYIVSLTSYPKRINTVWLTIESILRQTYKPSKVILWLSREEFESLEFLPNNLLKLLNRGLEIILVNNNLRSHKKYFYTIKNYPNSYLITVDDDIIYPENFLLELINKSMEFPDSICAHRGRKIKFGINDVLLPYNDWPELKDNPINFDLVFFTTGGGVIFPPNSLSRDVLESDVFMSLCPYADDVWLNFMAYLNRTQIIKTSYYSVCLPIINNSESLSFFNVYNSMNDEQIKNLCLYYKNINFFKN